MISTRHSWEGISEEVMFVNAAWTRTAMDVRQAQMKKDFL
jgi:hypothetical protein